MIGYAELQRLSGVAEAQEPPEKVAPKERTHVRWAEVARRAFDPLVITPVVIVALFAALAVGTLVAMGQLPVASP